MAKTEAAAVGTAVKIVISVLENEYLRAGVSSLGGELQFLYSKKSGRQYLWQGDAAWWEDRAPNLFPVCGRLRGLAHTVGGVSYPMPLHGFLWKSELAVVRRTVSSVTYELRSSGETRRYYPFDFTLTLTQELRGPAVHTVFTVTAGEEPLCFSYGGHPGFTLPMEEGRDYEEYSVEFEQPCAPLQLGITPDGLVADAAEREFPLEDGRRFALRRSLFAVEGVFLRGAARGLSLCRGDKKFITVRYPDCSVVGFWTSHGGEAPFVCVEPWAGTPDPENSAGVLAQKPDTIRLGAGETYTGGFSVTVGD